MMHSYKLTLTHSTLDTLERVLDEWLADGSSPDEWSPTAKKHISEIADRLVALRSQADKSNRAKEDALRWLGGDGSKCPPANAEGAAHLMAMFAAYHHDPGTRIDLCLKCVEPWPHVAVDQARLLVHEAGVLGGELAEPLRRLLVALRPLVLERGTVSAVLAGEPIGPEDLV